MYYITKISQNISTPYLENDKRVEFDTWKEARKKVISLELSDVSGLFAWKKDREE